jgi:hypothetical protein
MKKMVGTILGNFEKNFKDVIHSPKRLFSLLIVLLGVTTSFGGKVVKGEEKVKKEKTMEEQISDENSNTVSVAKKYFNWDDERITFNLSNSSLLTVKVNGIIQKFITTCPTSNDRADVNINYGRKNEPPVYDKEGRKFRFFKDERDILDYSYSANVAVPSIQTFKNKDDIKLKVVEILSLVDTINEAEHLNNEQKEFLTNYVQNVTDLSIDEVARIMLIIDPNAENWYSDMPRKISKAQFQTGRNGELIPRDDFEIVIFFDDSSKVVTDFFKVEKDEKGNYIYRELLSNLYFSDTKFDNLNPFFSEKYNIKEFTGSTRKGGNILYHGGFKQLFNLDNEEYLKDYEMLMGFVKEAEVVIDGKTYYDVGLLFEYVYPQIPKEYQADFSWFFSKTGKTIIDQRREEYYIIGFNKDKNRSFYLQRLPIGKLKIADTGNKEKTKTLRIG